jgi:hypothetical protein
MEKCPGAQFPAWISANAGPAAQERPWCRVKGAPRLFNLRACQIEKMGLTGQYGKVLVKGNRGSGRSKKVPRDIENDEEGCFYAIA